MKRIISSLLFFLLAAFACELRAEMSAESQEMADRWEKIRDGLFAGKKEYIGLKVRFTIYPAQTKNAASPVKLKICDGITVILYDVPESARHDVAAVRESSTRMIVEGVITSIDEPAKSVSIATTKVLTEW